MKPNISNFNNISDLINKYIEIESSILNVSKANMNEFLENIQSSIFLSNKDFYYIILFSLNFIMQSRPREDFLYKKVILSLQQDYKDKHFFQDENEIIRIFMFNEIALFHLGITKSSEYIKKIDHFSATYPTPLRYNPRFFSDDFFEKSIREDDIESFQILISRTNKDLSSYVNCPSVNPLGYFPKININQIQFISYSAFCGSLHIFKYLWMNENGQKKANEIPNDLTLCAIAGGNYEIIHILDKNIRKDKFSLMVAIRFFRSELIEYLIETCEFEVGIDELLTSIQCFNFKFFIEHCENIFLKNKNEIIQIVLFAADCGNTFVLNYISDFMQFDITQSSLKSNILIESVLKERINVLRFIFYENVFSIHYDKSFCYKKRPLFNVNDILSDFPMFNGLSVLHLVASNQLFDCANFFLCDELRKNHHVFVDVNVKDFAGATPLHWSVLFQNFNMFKLLISKSNAFNKCDDQNNYLINVDAVNNNGQNILHMACNNIAEDILRFLLQNEIIDPRIEDNSKENLIHYAARSGITYIFDYSCIKSLPNDEFIKENDSLIYVN